MDVCGDKAEEEFQVGLDEVPDDLVVVVQVVHFGNFTPRTRPECHIRSLIFHAPCLSSQNAPRSLLRCCLLCKQLERDKHCKAAHVNLVVL